MKSIKHPIAILIILAIPILAMIWHYHRNTSGFASLELIAYPLLFGGTSIIIIYLLKKHFLAEPLEEFNPHSGKWYSDLLWGFFLAGTYFILFFTFRATLADVLSFTPNHDLLSLMLEMRQNPILIAIWFGPVLWLGIALYEELVRVFLLTSFWKMNEQISWVIFSILITSLIFGIAHFSQGPYGMVTIGIKSLIPAFFFYHKRRIMPLIYAHVLYDGIQVALFLITYQA